MSVLTSRKLGCILGSAVADAAAQPLHWIYDLGKLHATVEHAVEIEFWNPSANPFYCLETGKQTCYGDQAHAILMSLAQCKGFNLDDQKQTAYKMFGPGTEYDSSLVDEYTGGVKKHYPLKSGWIHASIKYFLKKMDEGATDTGNPDDEQMDCVAKIAPIVAMYAGRPELLENVEEVIRMTEDNDFSVAIGLAAARMIEQCILTTDTSGNMLGIVQHVVACLSSRDRTNPQELDGAVAGFLRDVIRYKDFSHSDAVSQKFINS